MKAPAGWWQRFASDPDAPHKVVVAFSVFAILAMLGGWWGI